MFSSHGTAGNHTSREPLLGLTRKTSQAALCVVRPEPKAVSSGDTSHTTG
jgi:hypothetical protein